MTMKLQEFADRYVMALDGERIKRVEIDGRLTFYGEDFQLICEQGFTVEQGESSDWVVPGVPATVLPAVMLFNRRLESAIAYKNGMLRLLFEDGSALRALPHESYEAWNLQGADDLSIISVPGGELAVWSKPEQRSIEWLPGRKPSEPK